MTKVGSWLDLITYWEGDDGNYWKVTRSGACSNLGRKIRNTRGLTLDGAQIETLPELDEV